MYNEEPKKSTKDGDLKALTDSLQRVQDKCDRWREQADLWEAAYWALVRATSPFPKS